MTDQTQDPILDRAVMTTRLSYGCRAGTGPTLLLIPGSFSDREQWDGVIAALDRRLDVVIVELPGHGENWPPLPATSIEALTRYVLRVPEELSLDRYYVGGHSIGGMIAIEFARQAPAHVCGVVSVEGWTRSEVVAAAFDGQVDPTLSGEPLERNRAIRERVQRRWRPEQIVEFATAWTLWDGYDILAQTNLPILELWGDRGKPPPSRTRMAIPDKPNIEVRWFPNASHNLPHERPVEVGQAIMGFINCVEQGGPRSNA